MNAVTKPLSKAASWITDDLLGINPDSPQTGGEMPMSGTGMEAQAGGQGVGGVGASTGAQVPSPLTPGQPSVMNTINLGSGGPPPPTFGSGPEGGKPAPKGQTSTFLGQGALPARRKAAGGFGFDQQNSGTKTLIGH